MKALVSLVSSVLFLWAPHASAGWRVDGNDWRDSLTDAMRVGIVRGYVEGHSQAISVAPLYVCSTIKANDCYAKAAEGLSATLDFSNLTFGQLRDGLDSFYGDYRNRKIELPGALRYVVRSIRGAPASELEPMVEGMRKYAPK